MIAPGRAPTYTPVVITAAVLGVVPVAVGDSRYVMRLAIVTVVLASYALAANLLFGGTGQLFLCLGALAGLSSYGAVVPAERLGLSWWWTVPLGAVGATLAGALLSWITVRRGLETIFVGIVTLAFSLVFTDVVLGTRGFTGGETGLVVTRPVPTLLREQVPVYYLLLLLLVGWLALARWIDRSPLGWSFAAMRDDRATAELAGVDVLRRRVLAAAIATALVASTGALHAVHDGFVSPSTYAFARVDVRVLVALVLGGMGTLLGPVVGAVVVTVVDELLRPLGQLRLGVYGVVLVALVLRFRAGLVPAARAAGIGFAARLRSTGPVRGRRSEQEPETPSRR